MSDKSPGKVTPEAFDETLADPAEVREYYTRLIRGMVHNMNNILTIFQGYISILEMEAEGNEVLLEAFKHMQSGADSAEELLNDVLSASSRVQLTPREYSGAELADFIQQRLVSPFASLGTLNFHAETGDLTFNTDARKLVEVLQLIIENAFQASESLASPAVTVNLTRVDDPERPLKIEVIDQGVGISPDMLDQICIPFVTTRRERKQKGLGLPRALGILYRLGGRLKFSSSPGAGTTVTLWFPTDLPEPKVSGG